jgi:hypothetical protein
MKTFGSLVNAMFLVVVIVCYGLECRAQSNTLPPPLGQNSALAEILAWLDKNSFAKAWIGVNSGFASGVFSQGFKLIKADGCFLTLRNENVDILELGSTAYPGEYSPLETFFTRKGHSSPYRAELYLRLNRLNFERSKAPFLHTKKTDRAKLLGSWRTEFKEKSGRSRPQDVILITLFDAPPAAGRDDLYGENVTFTFDNKETSEKFYAVFLQAIRLCTVK